MHHNRHTGYKEFQCEKCENNFIQAINLKTHYISHTEDKPFKCSQCNKPFTIKLALNNKHSKVHDNRTRDHTCLRHLKEHQMSHSGDRPFGFPECEK